jgi:hypothetical protein
LEKKATASAGAMPLATRYHIVHQPRMHPNASLPFAQSRLEKCWATIWPNPLSTEAVSEEGA